MTKMTDKPTRDELLAWANERFRPRSATAPSMIRKNSNPMSDIARRARRTSPFRHRLGSANMGQSMESTLSGYGSNQTLAGSPEHQAPIADLHKKIEHLEKERDFYLNKLRNIENLCARFGELAKEERQARVPIKKIAEVLYQSDEGFVEADETMASSDGTSPKTTSKIAKIIEHQPSMDESFDPSAASDMPSPTRKISPHTFPNNVRNSPINEEQDEEKTLAFIGRRFSVENPEKVNAGILESDAHQPGNIALEEVIAVTPIIEDGDPEAFE